MAKQFEIVKIDEKNEENKLKLEKHGKIRQLIQMNNSIVVDSNINRVNGEGNEEFEVRSINNEFIRRIWNIVNRRLG